MKTCFGPLAKVVRVKHLNAGHFRLTRATSYHYIVLLFICSKRGQGALRTYEHWQPCLRYFVNTERDTFLVVNMRIFF